MSDQTFPCARHETRFTAALQPESFRNGFALGRESLPVIVIPGGAWIVEIQRVSHSRVSATPGWEIMKKVATILMALVMTALITGAQDKSANPKSSMPKCTEPLSNLDFPNGPHGLFVLEFPGLRSRAEAAHKYLLHNPAVCGANIYVVWSQVDQGPGASPRYDWTSVDERMKPWVSAGKIVNLVVWAVKPMGNRSATPDFIWSKVPSVECPHFSRAPVFWDKNFVTSYQTFMSAVLQKYGTNSSVGYIRFGLGAGGETYPACKFVLQRYGFSEKVWRDYLFEMMDYEKSLHSEKPLMIGINPLSRPPDPVFPKSVAEHAVRDGIGFGCQGFSADDMRSHASGAPCMAGWCEAFEQFRGKVPLQLQTIDPSNPDGSGAGSLVDLVPFGLKHHAQIFEIYLADRLIAYDPDSPQYAQYHAEYQRVLEEAAKAVGGH